MPSHRGTPRRAGGLGQTATQRPGRALGRQRVKGDLRREERSARRKEFRIRASEMETRTHTPPGQAPRTQRAPSP